MECLEVGPYELQRNLAATDRYCYCDGWKASLLAKTSSSSLISSVDKLMFPRPGCLSACGVLIASHVARTCINICK